MQNQYFQGLQYSWFFFRFFIPSRVPKIRYKSMAGRYRKHYLKPWFFAGIEITFIRRHGVSVGRHCLQIDRTRRRVSKKKIIMIIVATRFVTSSSRKINVAATHIRKIDPNSIFLNAIVLKKKIDHLQKIREWNFREIIESINRSTYPSPLLKSIRYSADEALATNCIRYHRSNA